MRKTMMAIIVILTLTTTLFAHTPVTPLPTTFGYNDIFNVLPDAISDEEITEVLYLQYLQQIVPELFLQDFYDLTKDNPNMGNELLGIAWHESAWRAMRGRRNPNGSYDYGPLMLNQANIESVKFMNVYAPENWESYENINVAYMITCINFYKQLCKEIKGYRPRLMVYNGGYRALRVNWRTELWQKTNSYANKVTGYTNKYNAQWSEFYKAGYVTTKIDLFKIAKVRREEERKFALAQIFIAEEERSKKEDDFFQRDRTYNWIAGHEFMDNRQRVRYVLSII